jgi:hypothetical protein
MQAMLPTNKFKIIYLPVSYLKTYGSKLTKPRLHISKLVNICQHDVCFDFAAKSKHESIDKYVFGKKSTIQNYTYICCFAWV